MLHHTGTPEWNTEAGGNHDWVEIWDGGVWSFTGPTEYTEKVIPNCSLLVNAIVVYCAVDANHRACKSDRPRQHLNLEVAAWVVNQCHATEWLCRRMKQISCY